MTVNTQVISAEENIRTYLTGMVEYISGATTIEPDINVLLEGLVTDDIITEASNTLNRFSGASFGVLPELIDRLTSITKEILLLQRSLSQEFIIGASEINKDMETWSAYLLRSLNTYLGKDASQK